jgi:hypothetical protein
MQHSIAGMQKMNQAEQQLTSNMREAMKNPATAPAKAVQQLDQYSKQLGSATDEMQGKEKIAGEAGQRLFKLLSVQMQNYATAYQAVVQSGFYKAKGINTREDLQHRREIVKAFGDANEHVADFYRNSVETLRVELKKGDLTDDYIETILKGFQKTASIDLVLKVRKCDADLVTQCNKILDIYDREWGNWHLDDKGLVIFQNPAAVADFNSAQGAIRQIADDQKGFQQQILKNTEAFSKQQ